MKEVISNLGEITLSNMMAYTINISPDQWLINEGYWKDMSPDEQYMYLKKLHRKIYEYIISYIDGDNKVCFEFTKKNEVHSHGYFTFKDKYATYKRYEVMIMKYVKKIIMCDNSHVCYARWAEDKDKWNIYITKELASSGYPSYIHDNKPITRLRKTIVSFIDQEFAEEEIRNETKDEIIGDLTSPEFPL